MTNKYIGIDIGGTKIAFVVADADGNLYHEERIPMQVDAGAEGIVASISDVVKTIIQNTDDDIHGIGIGCPGFVDSQNGIVKKAVHLKWNNMPLVALMQKHIPDIPIRINNDVRAIALGEQYFGIADNLSSYIYLTIGTGLGGSIVLNGVPLEGHTHAAHEIGHMALIPNGRKCICGKSGCLDMYLSGTGINRAWQEHHTKFDTPLAQLDNATGYEVLKAYEANDALAVAIVEEFTDYLIHTIVWLTSTINPEAVIISGGMGQAIMPHILQTVIDRLPNHNLLVPEEQPQIMIGTLQNTALGATSLLL